MILAHDTCENQEQVEQTRDDVPLTKSPSLIKIVSLAILGILLRLMVTAEAGFRPNNSVKVTQR